ncbi:MAG: YggS family pyridoxal phosphate-dependent enzyme [Chloroflexi bacterium]|nr:YggS family pyridoxal phosphate-dependent enzyme [Chloroflexota bacterium]
MSELVNSIRERYLGTLDKIASAAKRSGRSPEAVKLVVVTKAQPVEVARAAIEAGAVILGENYAEEGVTKIQSLQNFSAVEWHMIGHVQSRKAPLVAEHFNFMHSLDSLKLAKRLDRSCGDAGRVLPVLLEFNVGGEESKGGWEAVDESRWATLTGEISEILVMPNLRVRGLMSMPPLGETAEFSRPYFQKLRRLRDFLVSQLPQADFSELSMGTSSDYEVAVEEGATFVRVGTAIVGPRSYITEHA